MRSLRGIFGKKDVSVLVYLAVLASLSLYILISGRLIQYDWQVRMQSITLYFGGLPASAEGVVALYAISWLCAAAVVILHGFFTTDVRSKLLLLASIIALPLIILIPLSITYAVVWPAVLIGDLMLALGLQLSMVPILGAFVIVVLFHLAAVLLWRKSERRFA